MIPANMNINLYRGQTWKKKFTFKVNKQPIDLTPYTFKAQIRPTPNSETLSAEITCDQTDGAEGILYLSLTSAQTAALEPGFLVWDLRSVDGEETVDYWIRGNVGINGRVTV